MRINHVDMILVIKLSRQYFEDFLSVNKECQLTFNVESSSNNVNVSQNTYIFRALSILITCKALCTLEDNCDEGKKLLYT